MLAGAGLASCLRSQLPPGLRRENCLFLSRGKKLLENIKSKEVADQHHFLLYICAADFSLLNLPKGKSLGRSKPATNS